MNWDDLRIFLAVARATSLSTAAQALGVNQSTVSRRLAAMEENLGTRLIERRAKGHTLTAAGQELSAIAGNVEDEFIRVDAKVAGRDTRLSGRLRVTCVDMMVDRYLAPHVASFCAEHTEIELSLLTPFQPLDIMRREADVAVRVSASPPETLVGRRLFDFALAVYASPDFVDALPDEPDPAQFNWVGWASDDYNKRMITDNYPDAKVCHRIDSLLVLNALVQQGLGASVLPCYWADKNCALRRVYNQPVSQSGLGLWVLAHPDVRHVERVRAFTGFIQKAFQHDRDLFEGRWSK